MSAGSGASFATDEGPSDQTQQIERSSKSLSSLKPVRCPLYTSMCAVLHKCTSQHLSCDHLICISAGLFMPAVHKRAEGA